MSTAKLTLIGLDRYMSYDDKSIFDLLELPDGLDKEVLVSNIMIRGGEFEIMYPQPEFLRDAIGLWSRKWARTFTRWVKALSVDYEPLYNYDRTEEWTTLEDIDDTGTHTENNVSTGSDSSESSTDSTTTDSVSAYNSNALVNDKQSVVDASSEASSETQMSATRSGNDSNSRDREEHRTGRAYGNIGVTTSQQMLQAELDIALWNVYDHITDLFIQEFCIPVY